MTVSSSALNTGVQRDELSGLQSLNEGDVIENSYVPSSNSSGSKDLPSILILI